MQLTDKHRAYWRKNLAITAALLALWFVAAFVVAYFARELSFSFFGWPFSFYVAAQGALFVYLFIVGYYAHRMKKLDATYGVAEEDA